mgnify:CR=1 FL=1
MHRKGLHTKNECLPTFPTKTEQGHQKESEKRIVYRCSSRPITIFFRSNPRLNACKLFFAVPFSILTWCHSNVLFKESS